VRLIRRDTLPTGDDRDDDTVTRHGDWHGDDTGDGHRASGGDDWDDSGLAQLVTAQDAEIAFLRTRLESRTAAEAELRRLLLLSQQALTVAMERPLLPPVSGFPYSVRKNGRSAGGGRGEGRRLVAAPQAVLAGTDRSQGGAVVR
jgi:hypothetical protein